MSFEIKPFGSGIYTCDGYRVDLKAWNWNGCCSCATFTGFCLFMLTNQITQPGKKPKRQRCDHILAVREWVMENSYPEISEQFEKIIEMPELGRILEGQPQRYDR